MFGVKSEFLFSMQWVNLEDRQQLMFKNFIKNILKTFVDD